MAPPDLTACSKISEPQHIHEIGNKTISLISLLLLRLHRLLHMATIAQYRPIRSGALYPKDMLQ
eukprot:447657-Pelagomonas_calceolata.AAC.1